MSFPIVPSSNGENKWQSFKFGDSEIRIIIRNGEPWFLATDVCAALGIANVSQATERLYDTEKDGISFTDTVGKLNRFLIISESGLYKLIARSNKPIARQFQDWMFGEVMPTIVKTGKYENPNHPAIRASENAITHSSADAILQAMHQLTDKIDRLDAMVTAKAGSDYWGVVAFFKYKGFPAPTHSEAQSIGQKASKLAQRKGVKVQDGHDYYNNPIKLHREDILDAVLRKDRPDLYTLTLGLPEGEDE